MYSVLIFEPNIYIRICIRFICPNRIVLGADKHWKLQTDTTAKYDNHVGAYLSPSMSLLDFGVEVRESPKVQDNPEINWIFWKVQLKEIFWRVALVFRIRMAFTHPHQFKHLQNNSGHILLFNRIWNYFVRLLIREGLQNQAIFKSKKSLLNQRKCLAKN